MARGFATTERKNGSKYRHPTSSGNKQDYKERDLDVHVVSGIDSADKSLLKKVITAEPGEEFSLVRGKKLPKVHITEDNVRMRIQNPGRFEEFRTQSIGRGSIKRVAGLKKDGDWSTQAWLFDREDLAKRKKTQEQFLKILEREKNK